MTDSLILEVHDLVVNVLTGIYSQETHLPQRWIWLRIMRQTRRCRRRKII
jgi:dihydroneopterin aldolase